MAGPEYKITKDMVRSVKGRAAKYPANTWANQIKMVCDYAERKLLEEEIKNNA